MRTEHLQFLTELNNGESINALADKLHITPQGLSAIIISLEKELNCTLINRTKKGIFLTPDGMDLIKCTKAFLKELDRIKSKNQVELQGELELFTTEGSVRYLLSDKIARFSKENPLVKINTKFCNRNQFSLSDINDDNIFFTAVSYQDDKKPLDNSTAQLLADLEQHSMEFKPILTSKLCVECHKDMWKKSTIKLSELHGHKIFLRQSDIAADVLEVGFKEYQDVELESVPVLDIYYQYLQQQLGFGWSIYIDGRVPLDSTGLLKQVLLEENFETAFGYIEKKNTAHSEIVQRFIDFISY